MGRKYHFHSQDYPYIVTLTVVNWIDIFTRNEYRQVIINSLNYCQKHKGLQKCAWVMMTNHTPMIIGTDGNEKYGRDNARSGHIRKSSYSNTVSYSFRSAIILLTSFLLFRGMAPFFSNSSKSESNISVYVLVLSCSDILPFRER